MLSTRSTLPEELDNDTTDLATYQRVIAELAVCNRLTLTHRPTLRWLQRATKGMTEFSVLDVGYGDGDLLRAIAKWADQRGMKVKLSGIDLNPRSSVAARNATPASMQIDYQTGCVFSYAPPEPVDFIVSSQVTHHFTDEQVVNFVAWLEKNSARGWHIADLHRHRMPYYAFPVVCRLMGWHRIIRGDGMISIARSFRRNDWESYLAKAAVQADVSWHMFRYCVSGRNPVGA
jgi:2-polyprenyl-3-methyl-5-hydroxy-6-metoxy-1,4-benzoquinol methylase